MRNSDRARAQAPPSLNTEHTRENAEHTRENTEHTRENTEHTRETHGASAWDAGVPLDTTEVLSGFPERPFSAYSAEVVTVFLLRPVGFEELCTFPSVDTLDGS